MITTSTDYSGRQVDLEFLQTITKPNGVVSVSKGLAKLQPKMVAGIQKMLQRYTILLLSRLGNIYLAPEQGTTFLDDILRGGGRSRGHIIQTFAFANVDAIDQMRSDDNQETTFGTVPVDEQIARADLLDYSVNYATSILLLSIYVENGEGTSFTYIVPVPVPRT